MQQLLEETRDILMDWLDAQFGSSVTENSIFADLPRHYEAEYHEDMDALNVRISRSFKQTLNLRDRGSFFIDCTKIWYKSGLMVCSRRLID